MPSVDQLRARYAPLADAELRGIAASDDYSEEAHAVARDILASRGGPYLRPQRSSESVRALPCTRSFA